MVFLLGTEWMTRQGNVTNFCSSKGLTNLLYELFQKNKFENQVLSLWLYNCSSPDHISQHPARKLLIWKEEVAFWYREWLVHSNELEVESTQPSKMGMSLLLKWKLYELISDLHGFYFPTANTMLYPANLQKWFWGLGDMHDRRKSVFDKQNSACSCQDPT